MQPLPVPMSDEEAAIIRAQTRETVTNIINGEQNPIQTLATIAQDTLAEDEVFLQTVHRLVCRDMDLHSDTIVGLTPEEAKQGGHLHFLSEDDPRYDLYWETTSAVWNHVFATCIASASFRWTHEFAAQQRERRERFSSE